MVYGAEALDSMIFQNYNIQIHGEERKEEESKRLHELGLAAAKATKDAP